MVETSANWIANDGASGAALINIRRHLHRRNNDIRSADSFCDRRAERHGRLPQRQFLTQISFSPPLRRKKQLPDRLHIP
ncbi:hypothetical protein [Novosphingobium sp. PhB55]|uniref:hypothetical protein n=1 Tax=Novosphingobium sp. PhB55 TaxID=2485106 RepID=UPI001066D68B|nr:hypothetical protein [Novosphingobium sp. PhB55]